MENTRVKKGEKYWFIRIYAGVIEVASRVEFNYSDDKSDFESGNYFNTKEEAEAMAEKIRKVLNGADVYTQEEITEIKANAFANGMEAEQRKSKIVK